MQGNCGGRSDSEAVALIRSLPELTAGRVEYPPVKPFQCVLVIDKPFLWHNDGYLWIDNIYVALTRDTVFQDFSMLQHGNSEKNIGIPGNSVYVTNVTFVGEGRGDARAIHTGAQKASVLVEGAALTVYAVPA